MDCGEAERTTFHRRPDRLTFSHNSGIFVANAGSTGLDKFEVSKAILWIQVCLLVFVSVGGKGSSLCTKSKKEKEWDLLLESISVFGLSVQLASGIHLCTLHVCVCLDLCLCVLASHYHVKELTCLLLQSVSSGNFPAFGLPKQYTRFLHEIMNILLSLWVSWGCHKYIIKIETSQLNEIHG